ncbi:endonuclease MutS2 [Ammoniphilus sp. CFH 90114]|uniref:endonuclease MutS2 n=1 Tax=Ammoniphilus sp. CFH 90114 TaxID=2493665 RepID=UPI00100F0D6A|nr:endonuclease MutS2 [Ammoniphilus sp. CFH 90114]RXT04739.1 endonuclease MutS2 [Ammoniphilus sp. CFH 90114]
MEERLYRTLEFTKVIHQLMDNASSSLGREKIEQLVPTTELEEAKLRQQLTFEGYTVLRLKGSVPFGGIRDIRRSLARAKLGASLNPGELLDVAGTVYGGWRLRRFIEALLEQQELPLLEELILQIERLQRVEEDINDAIDEHGEVMDSASPALAQVRSQIRATEGRIKDRLENIIRSTSYQKMLQESIVTIRGDRYVIPVKQEYRHVFGGMIHDQSASGATLFIEPEAVVQANNQLRELRFKEEREVERILQILTGIVAEHADVLDHNVKVLAELDFTFAKASYAHRMKAVQPKLNNQGYMKLKKGRHPLIPLQEVVPIDVEIGKKCTSLVVTGPNTGGKTVTLKTIGLHALMAASGLHLPAEEDSEMAIFSGVYADIGDEQSIEQSLSTFSGHMTNIIRILGEMDGNSLVLLDELGAGTDPTEGAALAMAILDHMYQIGARVIATTHYSELKEFAYNRPQVLNASVEFDVETLRPTYRLLVGVPGRSNAFAIANRLGLPEEIIEDAKQHVSLEDTKVENMIASLEEDRLAAEQDRAKTESLRLEMENLRDQLEQERAAFAKEKNMLLQKAEEEASRSVAKARKEADEIISELRKMAQEEQVGIKEHRLIEAKKRLEESVPSFEREKEKKKATRDKETFKVGDEVKVLSLGQKGEIISDLGNQEYQVQLGIIKMTIKASDMNLIKASKKKEIVPYTRVKMSRETVRPELDLRGFTIEDAIPEIDKYLDNAVMSNLHQVSLIHGKGTGALRVGVHNFLKKHRSVKSYRLGGQGEGGLGATIVELK